MNKPVFAKELIKQVDQSILRYEESPRSNFK